MRTFVAREGHDKECGGGDWHNKSSGLFGLQEAWWWPQSQSDHNSV
jgi:hypothetical protein